MKIISIDYSITGTGIAVVPYVGAPSKATTLTTIKTEPKHYPKTPRGFLQRIAYISDTVSNFTRIEHDDMLLIEGLSMHSKSSSLDKIFGGWWMLLDHLFAATGLQSDPVLVPPTNRAMYATGNGSAGKKEVLAAARAQHPDLTIGNDNEGDALVIACMGARHLGAPLDAEPSEKHLRAMDKVDWGYWGGFAGRYAE